MQQNHSDYLRTLILRGFIHEHTHMYFYCHEQSVHVNHKSTFLKALERAKRKPRNAYVKNNRKPQTQSHNAPNLFPARAAQRNGLLSRVILQSPAHTHTCCSAENLSHKSQRPRRGLPRQVLRPRNQPTPGDAPTLTKHQRFKPTTVTATK